MNELNRTEPTRPVVSRTVRVEAEPAVQPESQAETQRIDTGNVLPEVQRQAEAETPPHETSADIRSQVEEAVASLNEFARRSQRSLEFSVDSELDRPVVQVIDASTREVIRQIPSETALSVARNLQVNLEQLDMQRAAVRAGVDGFVSADVSLGLVNTHA